MIMVLCNIERSFWDATASIRLTKNSTIVRLDCGNQIHAVVMDEEYVQEHIWIGCIVALLLVRQHHTSGRASREATII